MNGFFKHTKTIARMQEGPLGRYILPYAEQLQNQRYARLSGRVQIRLVADFSRWLRDKAVPARRITARHTTDFLRARKRAGRQPANTDLSTLARLLGFLRKQAVIPEPTSRKAATPSQALLEEYDVYLQKERALASSTRRNYRPFLNRFLAGRFGAGSVDLSTLRALDVIQFVQRASRPPIFKQARVMISALRSFLRFAQYRGDLKVNLASCVPSVASWPLSTVPRSLSPAHVEQVLAGCDRKEAAGRRDYAILLLLARLGLRGGEVASLTLEDMDWEAARITLRGKRGRVDQLPLPRDVGEAIAAYPGQRLVAAPCQARPTLLVHR